MSKTYDDLAALCGYVGATERSYDWETDTQPDFVQSGDFAARLRRCLRARADLMERYGTDFGFDALAWDAYLEKTIEDYARSLYLDFLIIVTEDSAKEALNTIRALMTQSQHDPEVQALHRAAEANWKGNVSP